MLEVLREYSMVLIYNFHQCKCNFLLNIVFKYLQLQVIIETFTDRGTCLIFGDQCREPMRLKSTKMSNL